MRAWIVDEPAPIARQPLRLVELPDPEPGPHEVRIAVHACGVCRTDLHVAEGDLPPRRIPVVPGHEIVGTIDRVGDAVQLLRLGQRIGIAWLRATCGVCRSCRHGRENLCVHAGFTGWTHDGGYAEFAVIPERAAYPIPDGLPDDQAAPLLCAGIIGYRALRRCAFQPGDRLGIWGFGGSAHLTAQLALAMGGEVYVVTRGTPGQRLARELGASWVGSPGSTPPVPLDAAISFAPAGEVVPDALASLADGATLAIVGIHVTPIPSLDYAHHLFRERQLCSVTANTRADGETFLRLARQLGVRATTVDYPFETADEALRDLAVGRFAGAAVLRMPNATVTASTGSG